MVEQSIEAALVVSSSLILGINGCAGIGRQVPFRPEWLKTMQVQALSPIYWNNFMIIREANILLFSL